MRSFLGITICLILSATQVLSQSSLDSVQVRAFNQAHYRVASFNYTGLEGHDGRIYFANESGLLSYDGSQWELHPINDFKSVLSVGQSMDSTIYIGGIDELGYMLEREGSFKYTSLIPLMPDTVKTGELWQIVNFDGDIYFSGYNGVFKYDGQQVEHFDLKNGHLFNIGGHLVSSVYEKGIYELIDDKPVLKNSDFNFQDDVVFAVVPRKQKDLHYFITSENGIWEFNLSTFETRKIQNETSELVTALWGYDAAIFQDSLYAISTWKGGLVITDLDLNLLKVVDSKNGLNTDEMKEVFVDRRNHIWVGTNRGISELYWDQLEIIPENVQSVITSFDEQEINSLSFEFATPGYHISELKYASYLEGFDKDYSYLGSGFKKEYTNLDGGEYTFHVRAQLPDGNYSKSAQYTFTIPTPWYLTAEAISFAILVIAGLFFLFYYLRTKQLRVMNDRLESVIAARTVELTNQQTELQQANENLRVINSELDNFVYRSSHDLVAPLKSLRGLVYLASSDRKEESLDLYFQKMNSSIMKLEEFIHSIMEYSTNSKSKIKYESINFDQMIEGICDDLRFYEKAEEIRLVKAYSMEQEVSSDIKRLNILLSNLITNAIKYHDYSQEDPFVELGLSVEQDEYVISVKDNGPGISKDHLDKIFDMFYRASEDSEGSGLGLYIVKETLKVLQGTIDVQSEVGIGTIFKIRITKQEIGDPVLA